MRNGVHVALVPVVVLGGSGVEEETRMSLIGGAANAGGGGARAHEGGEAGLSVRAEACLPGRRATRSGRRVGIRTDGGEEMAAPGERSPRRSVEGDEGSRRPTQGGEDGVPELRSHGGGVLYDRLHAEVGPPLGGEPRQGGSREEENALGPTKPKSPLVPPRGSEVLAGGARHH